MCSIGMRTVLDNNTPSKAFIHKSLSTCSFAHPEPLSCFALNIDVKIFKLGGITSYFKVVRITWVSSVHPLPHSFSQVLDRDSADVLEYILLQGDDDVFSLDPDTGALSLRRRLDFEKNNFYYLEVMVLDNDNNTDSANISVFVMVCLSFARKL